MLGFLCIFGPTWIRILLCFSLPGDDSREVVLNLPLIIDHKTEKGVKTIQIRRDLQFSCFGDTAVKGKMITVAEGTSLRSFKDASMSWVSRFNLEVVLNREKSEYLFVKPLLTNVYNSDIGDSAGKY